jgi:hypothetical protein
MTAKTDIRKNIFWSGRGEKHLILRAAICAGLVIFSCLASSNAQQVGTTLNGPVGINTSSPYGVLDVFGGGATDFIDKEIPVSPTDSDYAYNYLELFKLTTGSGWGAITIDANICALRSDDIGVTQCARVHVSRSYDSTIFFSESANATGDYGPFQLVTVNDGGVSWVSLLYDSHTWSTIHSWSVEGTISNWDFNSSEVPFTEINSITSMHSALTFTSLNTTIPVGKVGIGTASPTSTLEVNGSVTLTQDSGGFIKFADGTIQSTAYLGTTCPTGGDYAESIDVKGERTQYEPGDVMVIDPANPGHFLKSSEPYSTLVAGIYSTKPGFVGRRQTSDPKTATSEIPMAMVGIVPTKVSAENGPIKVGDLLVTSSTLGYVMKGTDRSLMTGAVVGKALGKLDFGTGVVEVLVTLQ